MTDRHMLLSLAVLRSAPAPGSPPQTGSCSPHRGARRHEEDGSYLREKHEEGQISKPTESESLDNETQRDIESNH